jgi:hypothetical protein
VSDHRVWSGPRWGARLATIPLTDYSLYGIVSTWHGRSSSTGQFETWWNSLSEDEQVEISAKVELLQERGPTLPRPHADVIAASRHANMKELRGKVEERHLRVLYAFDPRRTALLLLGGDKTGDPNWYEKFVPIADELFDEHLRKLKKERRK